MKDPKTAELAVIVDRHTYHVGTLQFVYYIVERGDGSREEVRDQQMGNAPGKWLPVPDETEEVDNLG